MDSLSANAVLALMPDIIFTLPPFGDVDLTRPAAALLVFLLLSALLYVVRAIVIVQLKHWAEKSANDYDDVLIEAIYNIRHWVYFVVAAYASLQYFTLPETVDAVVDGIFYLIIVWQAIEMVTTVLDFIVVRGLQKKTGAETPGELDPNSATMSDLVRLISRIVLWSIGIIFVLSNMGIEVTSLLAGLGIGGIAIAFALQGVLGDLFASFSIYFDKPFRIGDFIVIGNDMGTVEKIGIKSTRIRTLQGEELVVSNAELTTARVQNFKMMKERRIVVQFGITYETSPEKVRKVNDIVRDIFNQLDRTRMDRVNFASYGDFALMFELVYFVTSSDYNEYMDLQQEFNYQLMDRFAEEGIEFAYPTQTIYVKK